MWKAAAIQREVGVGFPGDATLVPVNLLVESLWLNADQSAAKVAPLMSLRLKSILTSDAIGVPRSLKPTEFKTIAAAHGFNPTFMNAFVPSDIGELVSAMHKPFDAPPKIAKLFEGIDERAIIAANLEYAKPQFKELDAFLPRSPSRPLEAGLLTSNTVAVSSLRRLRFLNAAFMFSILIWNLHAFISAHSERDMTWILGKWCGFLSHWTLVLVVGYLYAAARLTGANPPTSRAASDLLWVIHSIALPSSIAVVPLYWGMLLRPEYTTRPIHPSNAFVHGVNALCMLSDFYLSRRVWRYNDAKYVIAYGFINMVFMLLYFVLSGCPDDPYCDLDAEGHPYVYSVVDWTYPSHAAIVCLLAIFLPVALITSLLTTLSRKRGDLGPEPIYPFGANHNGTVALPHVSRSCSTIEEVSAHMKSLTTSSAEHTVKVRAIGSAKSNTKCLQVVDEMWRVDGMTSVKISSDREYVTAGAGCTLRDLAYTLAKDNLQLYSTVEIGNLTVGAMACSHTKNRHLPNEYGILSSYVCGVTMVDGLGRVHCVDEAEGTYTIDGLAADGDCRGDDATCADIPWSTWYRV